MAKARDFHIFICLQPGIHRHAVCWCCPW